MVTQYADQRFADVVQITQGFQRLWAAVDQIAHQPQPILCRVEVDVVEQALQGIKTTLQVADRVNRHQCSEPGTARRKGAITASKRLPSSASI